MPFGGDWKALYQAAREGELEALTRWLDQGVDPNFQHPEFGTTPLIAAAEMGQLEAVQALVARGARIDVVSDWDRCTAEQAALELGHQKVAHWLRAQSPAAKPRD